MEKEIEDFIQEFTDNFSELYVESFLIRYLTQYDADKLLEAIKLSNTKVQEKITKLFIKKLKAEGISAKDLEDLK